MTASAPRVIRRYAGGRLYDPDAGRNVSIEELRGRCAQGLALTVFDSVSGPM